MGITSIYGGEDFKLNLRATLKLAHNLLDQGKIDHALIGGLALACYGSTRATMDLDLIVHEDNKDAVINIFLKNGFIRPMGSNQ